MLAPYVQLLGLEHAVHRFGAVAHPIVNAKCGFCTSDEPSCLVATIF